MDALPAKAPVVERLVGVGGQEQAGRVPAQFQAQGQGGWRQVLGSGRQRLKSVLTDQSVVAGIGNAYSDDILHAARLSPFAGAGALDDERLERLRDAVVLVLGNAVQQAVGRAPDELKDAKRGRMRVHGRTGQACEVCGDTIAEVSYTDSSFQYCPTCQTGGQKLADRRLSRLLK